MSATGYLSRPISHFTLIDASGFHPALRIVRNQPAMSFNKLEREIAEAICAGQVTNVASLIGQFLPPKTDSDALFYKFHFDRAQNLLGIEQSVRGTDDAVRAREIFRAFSAVIMVLAADGVVSVSSASRVFVGVSGPTMSKFLDLVALVNSVASIEIAPLSSLRDYIDRGFVTDETHRDLKKHSQTINVAIIVGGLAFAGQLAAPYMGYLFPLPPAAAVSPHSHVTTLSDQSGSRSRTPARLDTPQTTPPPTIAPDTSRNR